MTPEQYSLLDERNILILPEVIDHDAYRFVLEACLVHPETIYMYCHGDGGAVSDGLAIADIISDHGLVVGILPGEANSAHATVFASCKDRYVYPNASIGLHKVSWASGDISLDAHSMSLAVAQFSRDEGLSAEIFGRASNANKEFWVKVMNTAGAVGITQISADEMINIYCMARPISELKKR